MSNKIKQMAEIFGFELNRPFFLRDSNGNILCRSDGSAYTFKFEKENGLTMYGADKVALNAGYYLQKLAIGSYTVEEYQEKFTYPTKDSELNYIYQDILEPIREDITEYMFTGWVDKKVKMFGEEKRPQYEALQKALETVRDKVCDAMASPLFIGIEK